MARTTFALLFFALRPSTEAQETQGTGGVKQQAASSFHHLSLFIGSEAASTARNGSKATAECEKQWLCDAPGMWHSQESQDRLVLNGILEGKRNGYFVDLAANHPLRRSNTRALERDYGWKGLCIDGNEEFLMLLVKMRTCTVVGAAVSSNSDQTVMFRHWHGAGGSGSTGSWHQAISGIVGFTNKANTTADPLTKLANGPIGFKDKPSVTIRFADLLRAHDAPKVIEYLSLDVEGAEDAVFEGFPFNEYRFLAISIERVSEALKAYLIANDYVYIGHTGGGLDQFFVHASLPGGASSAERRVQVMSEKWKKDKRRVLNEYRTSKAAARRAGVFADANRSKPKSSEPLSTLAYHGRMVPTARKRRESATA